MRYTAHARQLAPVIGGFTTRPRDQDREAQALVSSVHACLTGGAHALYTIGVYCPRYAHRACDDAL